MSTTTSSLPGNRVETLHHESKPCKADELLPLVIHPPVEPIHLR